MNFRVSSPSDLGSIRDIWEFCFDDSPAYIDFYFKNKYKASNVLVDEDVISSIHLNQHRINLRGEVFNTSYVVGVSTMPEGRGCGLMSGLMSASFSEMLSRDQSISILMPIDFRLYTKYGYTNGYNMLKTKVDIFALKKFKSSGEFKVAKSCSDLLEVYTESVSRFNGYAVRDLLYFEEFIEEVKVEGGYFYINYREGIPVGYLVYSLIDGCFSIREVYYKDIAAYSSILKFIFNHNTQASKVELLTATDDILFDLLDNPKDASFEVLPFMMVRVINFETLIERLNLSYSGSEFYLKVEDSYIEENNKVYKLYSDSGVLVCKSTTDAVIFDSIDISDLSSLVFGFSKVSKVEFLNSREFIYSKELKEVFDSESFTNHINEYV